MLEQQVYRLTDRDAVREIIAHNGWAVLVTAPPQQELVVSHLPVILDWERDDVVVLGHLARTDGELHALGEHDVVVVFQGPHGYISPSFYRAVPYVPTWNFVVVHLHGRPELLSPEQTYRVLSRTVDHFETVRDRPWQLDEVKEYANGLAPHTVGFRLRPIRTVAKVKLSQDKPVAIQKRVVHSLETDLFHGNTALARAMREQLMKELSDEPDAPA